MTILTIAVTGATGGLGQHLLAEALGRGHRVIAFARGHREEREQGVVWHPLDLLSPPADLPAMLKGADVVIHLAAKIAGEATDPQTEQELWSVNVLGTRAVIKAMREAGVPRLVLASTANFYSPALAEATEETPVAPESRTLYLGSKAVQEWTAHSLCRDHGIGCATMRIASVFGHGQNIVDLFARRLAAGESVTIHDDGAFGADFVPTGDVVAGLLLAAEKGLTGVYNLSSGQRTLLLDMARDLARLTGRAADAVHIVPASGKADAGFPAINCARLRAQGYQPTPRAEALARLVRQAAARHGEPALAGGTR